MGAPAQGFSQEEILAQKKELEQAQKKAGGIIDNSGTIAPGVVESGKMSQEAFDKMKGNPPMDKGPNPEVMSAISGIAKNFQNAGNAEGHVVKKSAFKPLEVEQPKDIMESRRAALSNLLRR
jgi:hypothetical protein